MDFAPVVPTTTSVVRPSAIADVCLPLISRGFACPLPRLPTNVYHEDDGGEIGVGVALCDCALVPESVPATRITDTSTLCALDPMPLPESACREIAVSPHLEQALVWRASQIPSDACPASEWDSSGPCGDASATVSYMPICVHVAFSPGVSASSVVVMPYVDPDALADPYAVGASRNNCTLEMLGVLGSPSVGGRFRCADRPCAAPEVVSTRVSDCADGTATPSEQTASTSPALSPPTTSSSSAVASTSFLCREDGRMAPGSAAGFSTGTVITPCAGASVIGAESIGAGPCTPVASCEDQCTARGGPCSVRGERADGTPCVSACPDRRKTRFRVESGRCVSESCGEAGLKTLTFVPCPDRGAGRASASEDSAGCVAYIDPVNATVPCVSSPCPCASGDVRCDPKPGVHYTAVSASGDACATATVDTLGRCCLSDTLDACGLCSGEAYDGLARRRIGFDAHGQCCSGESALLTRSLECCASVELVDACGVCRGTDETCGFIVEPSRHMGTRSARRVAASMSASLGARVVAMDGRFRVPSGLGQTPETLAIAYLSAVDADGGRRGGRGGSESIVVTPAGVPGNGVCEEDEDADDADCADTMRACPAIVAHGVGGAYVGDPARECGGNGACVRAAGACVCAYGYDGVSCGSCAEGFRDFPAGDQRVCVPVDVNAIIGAFSSGGASGAVIVTASVVGAFVAIVALGVMTRFRVDRSTWVRALATIFVTQRGATNDATNDARGDRVQDDAT